MVLTCPAAGAAAGAWVFDDAFADPAAAMAHAVKVAGGRAVARRRAPPRVVTLKAGRTRYGPETSGQAGPGAGGPQRERTRSAAAASSAVIVN